MILYEICSNDVILLRVGTLEVLIQFSGILFCVRDVLGPIPRDNVPTICETLNLLHSIISGTWTCGINWRVKCIESVCLWSLHLQGFRYLMLGTRKYNYEYFG